MDEVAGLFRTPSGGRVAPQFDESVEKSAVEPAMLLCSRTGALKRSDSLLEPREWLPHTESALGRHISSLADRAHELSIDLVAGRVVSRESLSVGDASDPSSAESVVAAPLNDSIDA